MKIKKVDDKPMVIHTKEKAKIHAHEPKGAKIKGSNIYTVERGPKVHDAKANEMDKKASAKLMLQKSAGGKRTYRKSTIHQSEAKDKGLSRFKRNIRESGTSIKTKNTNLHIAGRTGALAAGAVTEQVEGGHEVSQAAYLAYESKLIKTATEKLANVREDVKARDKELIDNPEFAITIGKATYTERVDGGTMMLEAISKCKTGETTAIGKFHGFELLVEKNFLGINYMVLRGKTEYKAELSTSPVGSMVKLENLFNGLHENIDFLEKKIEQYQNDLEASKAEYDKPFAYSKELEEKLARQCELNAQLDLENAKAVDADLSGQEEEREADDRMESAAIVAEDKGAYQADREGRTR